MQDKCQRGRAEGKLRERGEMGAPSLDGSELLGQTVTGFYEIILGCGLHYNLKQPQIAIRT